MAGRPASGGPVISVPDLGPGRPSRTRVVRVGTRGTRRETLTDIMVSEDRRARAMHAVQELAARLGLETDARILKDSNNTIVHLAPLPLVATVGTSHFRDASLEALGQELDVARHLASKGAPVVHASSDVPAGLIEPPA
jgi:hypothetical protein